ncbi:GNAT family N-acetyltransferase [Streptacidiphilus melanogenes]|uniref:GNAT family N-acetyltransferase n=1 Tax=Streptacidiphilus melanogenes TaxID=411235 RepID=UPI0005A63692|nr:GNAT family N-acetyltransferase [Streptacidiphilus melanogenes]
MSPRLPVLRTARLRLLRPMPEDLAGLVALHGDPETNRHNPDGPLSPERCEQWLAAWSADWERDGFGYFCVVADEAPEEILGVAGLKVSTVALAGAPAFPVLNLYYRFRPSVWGRGLAVEATGAALDQVRPLRADLPVCAVIRAGNLPSRRLAARLGLHETGEVDTAGRHVHLLGPAGSRLRE